MAAAVGAAVGAAAVVAAAVVAEFESICLAAPDTEHAINEAACSDSANLFSLCLGTSLQKLAALSCSVNDLLYLFDCLPALLSAVLPILLSVTYHVCFVSGCGWMAGILFLIDVIITFLSECTNSKPFYYLYGPNW